MARGNVRRCRERDFTVKHADEVVALFGAFLYTPGIAADLLPLFSDRHDGGGNLVVVHLDTGEGAAEDEVEHVVDADGTEIDFVGEDGGGAVVKPEEGAPGQARDLLRGEEGAVELADEIGDFPIHRGGDDVSNLVVGAGGEETGGDDLLGEGILVADAADLEVAAGGHVDVAVAEVARHGGESFPPGRRKVSACNAHSADGTIIGMVHLLCARATV